MQEVLETVGGAVVSVWTVALVHQAGHYFAGWRIVDIPRDELKLVSLLVPRYVALRSDTGGETTAGGGRDTPHPDEDSHDDEDDPTGPTGELDHEATEWVSPRAFERYRAAYERHDPRYEQFERYVTGGEIVQVLVLVPTAVALALAGFSTPAAMLLGASVATTLVFVATDAVRTRRSGSPSGDYSALWPISRRLPALLLFAFLFVHLGALYFVA